MPYFYKRPFKAPLPHVKKRAHPLVQPEWDDTIHDLGQLKLSPDQQLQRRLQRVSKNQWGMQLPAQAGRGRAGQEPARLTPSARSGTENTATDDDDDNDDGGETEDAEGISSSAARRGARGGRAVERAASPDDSDSDDDMCRWNQRHHSSPLHGTPLSGRAAASRHRHHPQQRQQQRQPPTAQVAADAQLIIDAGVMQLLLDKIDALEGQLLVLLREQEQQAPATSRQAGQEQQQLEAELLRQLSSSQEQLAATQQQLAALQSEHQAFVAHSSTLLTRLQAQLQQLLGQAPGLLLDSPGSAAGRYAAAQASLGTQPHQQQQQQQQQQPASSRLGAFAAALGPAPLGATGLSSRDAAAAAAGVGSPAKARSAPLAAAAVTTTGSPSKQRPPAAAAAGGAGGASSSSGAAAAAACEAAASAVADEARLPSYAEMRQRQSLRASGGFAGVAPGDLTPSSLGGTGSSSAAVPGSLQAAPATLPAGSSSARLFSRDVPPPIPAGNAAAAAAAAGSGGAGGPAAHAATAAASSSSAAAGTRWSNAAQVEPVFSEAWRGRLSALCPGLDIENELPGLADVDRGLGQGLSAVGRVFSAAGCAEAVAEGPRPRVALEQLRHNVSLRDHVRAAAGAGASGGVAAWQAGRM